MSFLSNIKKEINRRYAERAEEKRLYREAFRKEKLKAIEVRAKREGKEIGLGKRSSLNTGALRAVHGGLVSLGNRAVQPLPAQKPQGQSRLAKYNKPVGTITLMDANEFLYGKKPRKRQNINF